MVEIHSEEEQCKMIRRMDTIIEVKGIECEFAEWPFPRLTGEGEAWTGTTYRDDEKIHKKPKLSSLHSKVIKNIFK